MELSKVKLRLTKRFLGLLKRERAKKLRSKENAVLSDIKYFNHNWTWWNRGEKLTCSA